VWMDGWVDGILNFNQMSVQLRGFVGIFFFPVCAPLLLVGGVSSWQARKDANEREKKRDRDTSAVEIMSFLSPDPRNVRSGSVVSDDGGYYDGQSVVRLRTSSNTSILSAVFHHSDNHEGGAGLRLYHTKSDNEGLTWSQPTPIEESLAFPSHDGYQLVDPTSNMTRSFLFYGYNKPTLHYKDRDGNHVNLTRGDMQLIEGFRFRRSRPSGSYAGTVRHTIPVRRTAIDQNNPWGGAVMGAFQCDTPQVIGGAIYFAFQKTQEGGGETPGSEVFFMRSRDLLKFALFADSKDEDLQKATWETLPLGDRGLQAPEGKLALGEEPHIIQVGTDNPHRLMSFWRCEVGKIACTYSNDGGEHWEATRWLTYDGSPLGRPLKNPRGSLTPHPFHDGSVLLVWYNNGHTEREGYVGRRLYWICIGKPTAGAHALIQWSQPELCLWWDGPEYADRPGWNPDWAIVDGPGYPDFVELDDDRQNTRIAFIQSNKITLRFHILDHRMLTLLRQVWNCEGALRSQIVLPAPVLTVPCPSGKNHYRGPNLPDLAGTGGGYTVMMWVKGLASAFAVEPEQIICSSMETITAAIDEEDTGSFITKGFEVKVVGHGNEGLQAQLRVSDGVHSFKIRSDGLDWDGNWHQLTFVLDVGPRLGTCVVDDRLCDGGLAAAEGWVVFPKGMSSPNGANVRFCPPATVRSPKTPFLGEVRDFQVYMRPLFVSEIVAMYRNTRAASSSGHSRL
jgi:hypothetical protein